MFTLRLKLLIITLLVLTGCIVPLKLSPSHLQSAIQNSPYVAAVIDRTKYQKKVNAEDIEVHYRSWSNPFTKPDAIVDWKKYFVIGKESDPTWKYKEVIKVVHYQASIDDQMALLALKKIASENGGDAIVDVYREPIINKDTLRAWVIGFAYKAVVVIKT